MKPRNSGSSANAEYQLLSHFCFSCLAFTNTSPSFLRCFFSLTVHWYFLDRYIQRLSWATWSASPARRYHEYGSSWLQKINPWTQTRIKQILTDIFQMAFKDIVQFWDFEFGKDHNRLWRHFILLLQVVLGSLVILHTHTWVLCNKIPWNSGRIAQENKIGKLKFRLWKNSDPLSAIVVIKTYRAVV